MNQVDQHTDRQKNQIRQVLRYLLDYLKNPLLSIKQSPDWSWPTVITVQLLLSLLFGAISDFFSRDQFIILKGTLFFPISSFTTTFLGTGFFFLMIMIFFNTTVPFLRLYIIVFLSHLPFLFLRLLRMWVAPLELIGFAATTALLTIGFVENFKLPKKQLIKIFSILYLAYFLMWTGQQLRRSKNTLEFQKNTHEKIFENLGSEDDPSDAR